jgi:hypothetical protein
MISQFHSKEVDEEAKKVLKELLYLPKCLVMVCLMFRTSQMEAQGPEVVDPTPEQITAIL